MNNPKPFPLSFVRRAPSVLIFLILCGLLGLILDNAYWYSLFIFIGLHTILALGLALLMGYAGQVSLGQQAFYGLGAYISAILAVSYGLNPWLTMAIAIVATGVLAYLIGWPLLHLRGYSLAMGTLALSIIVYVLFNEWGGLTGGPSGFGPIPALSLGPLVLDTDQRYFFLVLACVSLVLQASLNLVNSRAGRALRALHDSEMAAEASGVDTEAYKRLVFVIGAVYAALAGTLYAHYLRFINPQPFGFHLAVVLITMVVVGGIASVWGSVIGATVITMLTDVIRAVAAPLAGHGSAEYQIVVFGLLLMVIMIFYPEGLGRGLIYPRFSRERFNPRAIPSAPLPNPHRSSEGE